MAEQAAAITRAGGFENVSTFNETPIPGAVIHEMGTARMGADPKQSVVNRFNQLHDAPNVFVTDGACMTSTACQNPSLTYMALTARAATFAIDALKAGRL
jgi:choline dehydrogenase-like flavoprotein